LTQQAWFLASNLTAELKFTRNRATSKSKFSLYGEVKFKLNKILSRCAKFSKKIVSKARDIRFYSAF